MFGKVVHKLGDRSPNGREMIAEVHRGKKGKGEKVGARVIYWPWSTVSCEKAEEIVGEIARLNGLTLVEDSED